MFCLRMLFGSRMERKMGIGWTMSKTACLSLAKMASFDVCLGGGKHRTQEMRIIWRPSEALTSVWRSLIVSYPSGDSDSVNLRMWCKWVAVQNHVCVVPRSYRCRCVTLPPRLPWQQLSLKRLHHRCDHLKLNHTELTVHAARQIVPCSGVMETTRSVKRSSLLNVTHVFCLSSAFIGTSVLPKYTQGSGHHIYQLCPGRPSTCFFLPQRVEDWLKPETKGINSSLHPWGLKTHVDRSNLDIIGILLLTLTSSLAITPQLGNVPLYILPSASANQKPSIKFLPKAKILFPHGNLVHSATNS